MKRSVTLILLVTLLAPAVSGAQGEGGRAGEGEGWLGTFGGRDAGSYEGVQIEVWEFCWRRRWQWVGRAP